MNSTNVDYYYLYQKYKQKYVNLKYGGDKISIINKEQLNLIIKDIYYLNITELVTFCDSHNIPYVIYEEQSNGQLKKTSAIDRKEIIIKKILKFIEVADYLPSKSIIPFAVINKDPLPKILTKNQKIFYGQYSNANNNILLFMKKITDGQFKFGSIAQKILWDNWTSGKALTFEEFAKEWLNERVKRTGPIKEWAYLTDLHEKNITQSEWKKYRIIKAKAVIEILDKIRK